VCARCDVGRFPTWYIKILSWLLDFRLLSFSAVPPGTPFSATSAATLPKSASPNPAHSLFRHLPTHHPPRHALADSTEHLLRGFHERLIQPHRCVPVMSVTAKPGAGTVPTSVVNPSAMKKKPYPLWLGGE
jgi:hypothetical protein